MLVVVHARERSLNLLVSPVKDVDSLLEKGIPSHIEVMHLPWRFARPQSLKAQYTSKIANASIRQPQCQITSGLQRSRFSTSPVLAKRKHPNDKTDQRISMLDSISCNPKCISLTTLDYSTHPILPIQAQESTTTTFLPSTLSQTLDNPSSMDAAQAKDAERG
jgi:hypothetical protein